MNDQQNQQQQQQALLQSFKIFDRDSTGSITVDKLAELFAALGRTPSETELRDIMNDLDPQFNAASPAASSADFNEFCALMLRLAKPSNNPATASVELYEAFTVFDRNGDGSITAAELKSVMRSLGEQITDNEVEDMILAADANGDGKIDFQEFSAIMQ